MVEASYSPSGESLEVSLEDFFIKGWDSDRNMKCIPAAEMLKDMGKNYHSYKESNACTNNNKSTQMPILRSQKQPKMTVEYQFEVLPLGNTNFKLKNLSISLKRMSKGCFTIKDSSSDMADKISPPKRRALVDNECRNKDKKLRSSLDTDGTLHLPAEKQKQGNSKRIQEMMVKCSEFCTSNQVNYSSRTHAVRKTDIRIVKSKGTPKNSGSEVTSAARYSSNSKIKGSTEANSFIDVMEEISKQDSMLLRSTRRYYGGVSFEDNKDRSWQEPSKAKKSRKAAPRENMGEILETKSKGTYQRSISKAKKAVGKGKVKNDKIIDTHKTRNKQEEVNEKLKARKFEEQQIKRKNEQTTKDKKNQVGKVVENNVTKTKEQKSEKQCMNRAKVREAVQTKEFKVKHTEENQIKKMQKEIKRKGKNIKESVEGKSKAPVLQAKELAKPEDCVITAKRGTLKYLQQREKLVKALAKEAEEEDDFFSSKDFARKPRIDNLFLDEGEDETLMIKTPQRKDKSCDGVITPRTALLGQWGVTEQCSTAYTPTTKSPVADVSLHEQKAVMQTIYHHLKAQGKRPRGIRKIPKKNPTFETVLAKPSNIEFPDLHEIPESNDSDSSHDDYFDSSDAY